MSVIINHEYFVSVHGVALHGPRRHQFLDVLEVHGDLALVRRIPVLQEASKVTRLTRFFRPRSQAEASVLERISR